MPPITFTTPLILTLLATLPLLWWLLRLTPPTPKKIIFPALMLLQGLVTPRQTPEQTPWWLLALRLLIITLLILAFAEPIIAPPPTIHAAGTLLIAIDNDWASARAWQPRQKTLHDLIHQAERENRPVILLATTPNASGDPLQITAPLSAPEAQEQANNIIPQPWPSDWSQATKLLQQIDRTTVADAVWLSSGLGNPSAKKFFETLQQNGGVKVLNDPETPLLLLTPPQNEEDHTILAVQRANTDKEASYTIAAQAQDGHTITRFPLKFTAGSPRATTPLNLSLDLRNQIARFQIETPPTAATTVLLDTNWQHRTVGLIGDKQELAQHSLLSSLFTIERALKPFADLKLAPLDELMKESPELLILTDTTALNDQQIQPLTDWIKKGGILIRFAGERLATSQNPKETDLLPVTLRTGDRSLGGALSWATLQKLQTFPPTSPFHNLEIPTDVTINRQILAEPSTDLTQKTWASLEDGTPLVTAKPLGQGFTILFHVPAKSDWSNLPLSGLFVDMLRRILALSHSSPNDTATASPPPLQMLNAFADLTKPTNEAQPLTDITIPPSPQHPPGLYGTETQTHAFNLGNTLPQPEALTNIPTEPYKQTQTETNLKAPLLTTALFLLLLDFLISLTLRGILIRKRKPT